MAAPLTISDIKGLTPAIEPVSSRETFALAGRNYIFDSLGPKSAFGNRLLLPHTLGRPEHVQGFRLRLVLGDRVFCMAGDAIMEWDESLGGWRIRYMTPDTTVAPYRWTMGYLNGVVYFCHPRTGILEYDLATDVLKKTTGPGVPLNAIAIAVNSGRLIAVTPDFFHWSAASNGRNWNPQLGGPGFQKISERVSGDVIMVTPYSRGCLTWCTGGVMRSEFTGDVEVYRHRPVNTDFRPINSFCTMQVDEDTVVVLDRRGLYQSQGDSPKPYTPVFNEFLIEYIKRYKLYEGQNIRLEWDELARLVYVSVSLSFENPIYEKAFVLYPPLDKWGQFSDSHYGIIPSIIRSGERKDDYFGYVGSDARFRLWSYRPSRDTLPSDGDLNLGYPVTQKQAQADLQNPGTVMPSSFKFYGWDESETNRAAGYYQPGGETPMTLPVTGLDSWLNVGLIRLQPDLAHDELSQLVSIKVSNTISSEVDVPLEDYNLVPPGVDDEDWNVVGDTEDFGLNPLTYVNHGLEIISTNDGSSEFLRVTPQMSRFNRSARYYTCEIAGIWHIIRVSAATAGENFHVRSLELTAVRAGRLI